MDPGTALGVVSLALDVIKDVYKYYNTWKGRDADIEEIKRSSLSLKQLFETVETTLDNDEFDNSKVRMIRDSVITCQAPIDKLAARLRDVKRERKSKSVMQKLDDQRRRALYPFQKETIVEILKNITTIKREIDGLMIILNLETTAKTLAIGKRAVSLLEQRAQDIDRQKVFEWLDPVNQADLHDEATRRHAPGTGNWFFNGEVYRDWKSRASSVIWICANAGVGKTVLFSSVIRSIESDSMNSLSSSMLAYFYCSYRKDFQHNLSHILRTLIAQLCPPDFIPGALQTLFEKHSSKFPPSIPSQIELQSTLRDIMLSLTAGTPCGKIRKSNIFVLLDALDELSIVDRHQVTEFLVLLASYGIEELHILVTSRELSEISSSLTGWGSPVLMDKKGVVEDIRLFVNRTVEQHPRLSQQKPAVKEQIKSKLVNDSNPLFQWTALQLAEIKSLNPMTPRNITQTLQSLPQDLGETYTQILNRIPKARVQVALYALRWISLALRPLFVEEIVDACAMDLDADAEFDTEERYRPEHILDALPGLLTINPPLTIQYLPRMHTISFSHFSVLEYLRTDVQITSASSYHIDLPYSHGFIAKACLAYLNCTNTFELRKHYFPLRGYAWDYWAWHASYTAQGSENEVSIDARELFNSVVQPDLASSQEAVRKLEEKLSCVKEGRLGIISDSKKSQLGITLRLPFFYEEFQHDNASQVGERETSVEFSFEPLRPNSSEIRLIELFPSASNFTEVRCRVFHVSLDENPKYDAVSYFWSAMGEIGHVRSNGLLHAVPLNLVLDIQNLRANIGNSSKVIFADAISFAGYGPGYPHTDESLVKKSRMPRVCKQAAQVAIGLGGRADKDADSIEFIQDFVSTLTRQNPTQGSVHVFVTQARFNADKIGQSVFELFQRGWWLRLWPVQEVVLPSKGTLYYGDTAMTFQTFERFFEMERSIQIVIGKEAFTKLTSCKSWIGARRVASIRSQYHSLQYPTLPQLLWATQYHETRERAVKVYGLLGMLDPEEQKSKLLEFDASISAEENYTCAALHIFIHYPNLDILSYASIRLWEKSEEHDVFVCKSPLDLGHTCQWETKHNEFRMPSWVPNFGSSEWGLKPLITGVFGPRDTQDVFNVGKCEEVTILDYSINPTYIKLQGIWFADVIEIRDNQDTQQFAKHHAILCQNTKLDEGHFEGRQMFHSSKGNLCLGPNDVRLGDMIVVMPGGKVPYVLRKTGDNHEFVGDCYVEGIMNGEAITEIPGGATLNTQQFCIV